MNAAVVVVLSEVYDIFILKYEHGMARKVFLCEKNAQLLK